MARLPIVRRQLGRWVVVGVVVNVALYLVYLALTRSMLAPEPAMTVVYVMGVIVGFIANRSWSFAHKGPAGSAFFRYILAYLFGYVVNYAGLHFGVVRLNLPHEYVQAVMIGVVAAMTFLLQKFYVFAGSARA